MFVVALLTSISYIATSANLPLKDEILLAFDRALGFDFRSHLRFVNDRPWMISILVKGYDAIHWQLPLIALALPLAGYYRRVSQFIFAFTLSLFAVICISTVVPAIGVYGVLQLTAADFPNIVESGSGYPVGYSDTMRVAPLLRDGTLRVMDVFQLAGVLTFPSFHAISAVLYAWAFWPMYWLRPLNLLCNVIMILATPVGGGHFLVDILAGILVAVASIYLARHVSRALASASQPQIGPGDGQAGSA